MTLIKIPARYGRATRLKKGESIKVINDSGTQVVDTWAFNADEMSEFMSLEHTRALILRLIPRVGDGLLTNKRRPILTITEDTCGVHDTLIAACDIYRYQVLGVKEYHRNCTDNLHEGLKDLGLTPPEVPDPLNLWMNKPRANDPKPSGAPDVAFTGAKLYRQNRVEGTMILSCNADAHWCSAIQVPSPLNLWMNIPWTNDPEPHGSLGVVPPVSKPGDYVVLRAEMDCICAFSACPQDILPVNGVAGTGPDAGKFIGEIHDCHFEVLTHA